MSVKIHYRYRSYPYSKKATEYSHTAKFFLILTTIIAVLSPMEIADAFGKTLITDVVLLIASIIYIVLYFTVIRRKIDEIARKDYAAEMNKRMNIKR